MGESIKKRKYDEKGDGEERVERKGVRGSPI